MCFSLHAQSLECMEHSLLLPQSPTKEEHRFSFYIPHTPQLLRTFFQGIPIQSGNSIMNHCIHYNTVLFECLSECSAYRDFSRCRAEHPANDGITERIVRSPCEAHMIEDSEMGIIFLKVLWSTDSSLGNAHRIVECDDHIQGVLSNERNRIVGEEGMNIVNMDCIEWSICFKECRDQSRSFGIPEGEVMAQALWIADRKTCHTDVRCSLFDDALRITLMGSEYFYGVPGASVFFGERSNDDGCATASARFTVKRSILQPWEIIIEEEDFHTSAGFSATIWMFAYMRDFSFG